VKTLWLLTLLFLPSRLKIELLRLQGHKVSRKSHIGFSWLDVGQLEISDGASIGPLNVFKGLNRLSMGQSATIGRLNQFTASRHYAGIGGSDHGVLELADGAVITMRHYFDCQSAIRLGRQSLIAGLGTAFFTHQKGIKELHEAKAIDFGPRVYLGAACVVLPGARVAGHAYIVSGSIVGGNLEVEYSVYSSPRAQAVKQLDRNAAYFCQDAPTAKFE